MKLLKKENPQAPLNKMRKKVVKLNIRPSQTTASAHWALALLYYSF